MDPRDAGNARPLLAQFLFIFMQWSAKILQSNRLLPQTRGLAPPHPGSAIDKKRMKLKTHLNNASSLCYTMEEIFVSIYHPINDLVNISGLVIHVSHVQASCRVCIVTMQLDTL